MSRLVTYRIPASYVLDRVVPTAAEIAVGLGHGWLERHDAVAIATEKLGKGLDVTSAEGRLALLLSDDYGTVDEIALDLAISPQPTESRERLWLFLALEWLADRREDFDDPYLVIDQLFEDFDHPSEIADLVRWMPLSEGNQSGLRGIDQRWAKYLHTTRTEYAERSATRSDLAVKPLGLTGLGLGLGLLYFVLQVADVGLPTPLRSILGIASVVLILYGLSIAGPSAADPQPVRYLALQIEEMEPRRITDWNDDWRITIRVTNNSPTANVSAYLLAPVQGLADPDYGDINLQWETTNTNFTTLVTSKPERLHIARVSDGRKIRFLSPGNYGGMPREFQQPELKVTHSPIHGELVFNGREGGCEKRLLEIHLNHSNKPTVHIGDAEPCQKPISS